MIFRQYQLGCLSHYSYLVGDESTGRAVLVDPRRDVSQYLTDSAELGLAIERVIETHAHADFVSGHLEVAAATGAVVSYGSVAAVDFPIDPLEHGERLSLGDVELEIRHTPGHTPESICLVIREHGDDAEPWGVLTGDTLFVGDVGRPDLLASSGCTADELARSLHRSLHEQLLTLPDATRVYPAHGAGSACGRSMSDAPTSTIGEQRVGNYALQPMSVEAFVDAVTQGQSVAPLYFAFAAEANRRPHALLDDDEPPAALDIDEVLAAVGRGAVVIDGRPPELFASGHLRGSVNVGLDGRFAEYCGDVVRAADDLVLVTDPGRETEARVRLGRIGFDRVIGHLPDIDGVLASRPDLADRSRRLAASDLATWRADVPALQLVDVRNPGEQEAGIIDGAMRIPLAALLERVAELDPREPVVVYCAGGYRSTIAASCLRRLGFAQVADIVGGYAAWQTSSNGRPAPEG